MNLPDSTTTFRIAVITTVYYPDSHADVIVSRWLAPRPTDYLYGWASPKTQIASMHVVQLPENDLSGKLCREHEIPRYDSVAEALTLGGETLAVDGILLIGEHGDYPLNEFDQKLYPRKELFDQITEVFRDSKKTIPLFFDKHLSWDPASVHEMFWTIKDLEIPFFGGSSLPHSPLIPSPIIPEGAKAPKEIVAIFWNCVEAYLFHSLELVQAALENFPSTETGTASIIAWKDEGVWDALERGEFSAELLKDAAAAVGPEAVESLENLRCQRLSPVCAFQVTYGCGLKVTHFMQKDHIKKWSLACQFDDSRENTAAYVQTGGREHFFPHFTRLNRLAEDFFLTKQSPIPLERLYLTSMATAACMQALATPGRRIPAPWLKVPVSRELHC